MGQTANRKYDYPEHATQPPDVSAWLKTGLDDVDADMVTTLAQITALANRFQYGPVANVPASLPPGHFWYGY